MRTGIATFPLDWGTCPRWLFERMKKLARGIIFAICQEFGPEEFLRRLSDPFWFQALGCILGFDWNSSGLTTTTLGAIKAGIFDLQDEIGIYVCGGKGKTSRKTPEEIETYGISRGFSFAPFLIFLSKMTAKVDSALIQDGFQIYHHNFIFSSNGTWTVIQQGMNPNVQAARRYHWFGDSSYFKNFGKIKNSNLLIEEPHTGIASQIKVKPLNLTAKESQENREVCLEMTQGSFKGIEKDLNFISKKLLRSSKMRYLFLPSDEFTLQEPKDLRLDSPYLKKKIYSLTCQKPKSFSELLYQKGVGPKTIRALSLIGEVIYGAKPSYEDPARYSFAHGGKDGVPYPVNLDVYDRTIEIIEKGIKRSQISLSEKEKTFQKVQLFFKKNNLDLKP